MVARRSASPVGCRQQKWNESLSPKSKPAQILRWMVLADLSDFCPGEGDVLDPIITEYRSWISKANSPWLIRQTPGNHRQVCKSQSNGVAANRIAQGIALLEDPQCLAAFKLANHVMAVSGRRRLGVMQGNPAGISNTGMAALPVGIPAHEPARHCPAHPDKDREVVDLLFFPTGGGKTEAYLGLAAFTLILRRMHNPGICGAGVSVLMRYTLRLLTLDQLGRAATLICALELERQRDLEMTHLGEWPF